MSENRRQHFRVEYPSESAPKLLSSGEPLKVLDLSEQGLRFQPKSTVNFKSGNTFAGSLTFQSGESFLVFGTIQRVNANTVSIELKKPIPLRIIMAEQRRLIQTFQKRA
ncbi:MAG: hypothetical protein FJ116_00765 [Deltaproteobacteria bacterium]|nr:hypothetical protein [Deltaproteobacteria bacterium]